MERRLLSRVSPFGTLHPPTCYPAQQELEVLMAKATAHPDRRLISSEDVQGTEVYGAGDKAIGGIDHLLIEKVSGRVTYAVMSFGGFLGLGHSHYPIPWAALKYDTNLGGYRTGITEGRLRDAPPTWSYGGGRRQHNRLWPERQGEKLRLSLALN